MLRPPMSISALSVLDPEQSVVVVGKESTGKTQLLASLTGRPSRSANFRGSTVACEAYRTGNRLLIDTPGILRSSDSRTTRLALQQLATHEVVLLVVQATHLDDDLRELLPLAAGRQGVVVVTFWDKVAALRQAHSTLDMLSRDCGLRFIPVDARHVSAADRDRILRALDHPQPIDRDCMTVRAGWRVDARSTWLERRYVGLLAAIGLILLPPVAAAWVANTFADRVDSIVRLRLTAPAVAGVGLSLFDHVLFGRYGLVTMGPLLFVWAVPTVIIYALLLGAYKASGLLDRLTTVLHPVTRPFGVSGRDLVRVIMGFGCNVPAIVSARSCSACSRRTCMAAIAFGSACSYQFGATLAVFAAARRPGLIAPYVLYLAASTLLYSRLVASREARSPLNLMLIDRRVFLTWPDPRQVWTEAQVTVRHFFRQALPVFGLLTVAASVVDWSGALDRLAAILGPAMALFHLPQQAALPLVISCIRKDGILLFSTDDVLHRLAAGQLLTGTYLAGVFAPCLVTVFTIGREESARFALLLVARQAAFALVCACALGQICRMFGM
jgi:ferrous iron transport protein B